MTEYKLTYYDIKGRAEVIRLIFAAVGKKFDDIRLEYRKSTDFKSKAPFGQV
jgi:glutathione S-transferase